MKSDNLKNYILGQIQAGKDKNAITEQLSSVGWSEEDIDSAYAKALVENGVPIPESAKQKLGAKRASTVDTILSLFSFILLGTVIFSLGALWFAVINYYFPDSLDNTRYSYYRHFSDTIHYAISALIISYPLYYLSVKIWFKRFREEENKKESRLTKWVTYLVLLAVSITIVGDLITIVYTFLQGEISTRFFLKALVVLFIAGLTLGFYYLERKKVQYHQDISRRTFQSFGYALTTFVTIGIVLGFLASGSPATERMRTFDEKRADDLYQIANCIQNYANQYQSLPASLSELSNMNGGYCNLVDPEKNTPYEYKIISNLTPIRNNLMEGKVQLCANFALDTTREKQGVSYKQKWYTHRAGRDCDTENITVRLKR